jgi:probable HAF family extracellular repeat protein
MVTDQPTVACHAFLWKNGVMTDLGTLGGQNSATENRGLNNRGQVAGAAETATVDPTSATGSLEFHAFLWRQGKMIDLGTLGGAPDSFAYAINDHGQVVGENITNVQTFMSNEAGQGFIWQDGKMRLLGTLGGTTSSPHAINNRGQVAGGSSLPGDVTQHAFLLQDGHMADLGTLPGDVFSEATAITEQGQVLGLSCSSKGCRATLWDKSTVIDLNTLISPASGWQLTDAEAENSRGQIVGGGLHNGLFRAFLLTPVH